MNLPADIAAACQPMFDKIPLEKSMPTLKGVSPHDAELVESVLAQPAMQNRPSLAIGLWLYVDNLYRAHDLCQDIHTLDVSYWHAIMHRREGDYPNSRYWHAKATGHALLAKSPNGLVPEVEAVNAVVSDELLAKQQAEWSDLFCYCAHKGE